jgi:hypothetical protein
LASLSSQRDDNLMAAIMAAVQAYLEEEEPGGVQLNAPWRAWKMTAWRPIIDARFQRRLPWKGR